MKDIAIWIAGIATYTAAVWAITKWVGKACDRTCPDCKGACAHTIRAGGNKHVYKCLTCNGEGTI